MTEALTQLWRTAADIAPKVALFALLLIAGYIIARLIRSGVTNVLMRARLDHLLNKAGLNNNHDTNGSAIGGLFAYYAVLLITLQLAFGVFGDNPISHLLTSVIAFLPRLLVAIALVVVAALIANAVRTLIINALGALKSYTKVVATIAHAAIIALGAIAALGQVGVATAVTLPVLVAALATAAGILIVGVGGGLIKPMQQRWENYLSKAEAEASTLTQTDPVDEPELELDDDAELDDDGEPTTRTTVTIRRTEV
jgi:hypothetical protein